jgi:hypothetical protein
MTQVGSLVASLKEELQAINALPYAIVRRAFAGGD